MDYIDETKGDSWDNLYKDKRAGWDDLYKDCFDGINEIIKDNLELKHNKQLIENIFSKMVNALDKAIQRMNEFEGEKSEKEPWFFKANNLKEYIKEADNLNKKVIAISLIDQFLRATY